MRGKWIGRSGTAREIRFMLGLFAAYMAALLALSAGHTGLTVFMRRNQCSGTVQVLAVIAYWGLAAWGIALYAMRKIKRTYELPMRQLVEAASKVAEGDFSVYVPPLHTSDNLDYLDAMILNFNKMVEELGSIETLKKDFISDVSHEMRTPIAIIKNYAEMLRMEQAAGGRGAEYAKSIEDAATRLSILIGNILKLNKLENQNLTPEMKTYDVCRQICECILQFDEAWEEKEIELETEIEDTAMVRADPSLMDLVWNNLLGNALKFTEKGGKVTVTAALENGWVRASVSDTGCGMSQETMEHIFDKFYQGDTSHSVEGSGLGLALVKRVLKLMGGRVEVASQVGKGSSFTVTLPAADGKKGPGGAGVKKRFLFKMTD